jgi:hypothetical protein
MRALPVVLLLAGCATAPQWTKPGADAQAFETDRLQCEYQAMSNTAAVQGAMMAAYQAGQLMQLCMRTKGWQQSR